MRCGVGVYRTGRDARESTMVGTLRDASVTIEQWIPFGARRVALISGDDEQGLPCPRGALVGPADGSRRVGWGVEIPPGGSRSSGAAGGDGLGDDGDRAVEVETVAVLVADSGRAHPLAVECVVEQVGTVARGVCSGGPVGVWPGPPHDGIRPPDCLSEYWATRAFKVGLVRNRRLNSVQVWSSRMARAVSWYSMKAATVSASS